jgi:hypothetical protein
MLTKRAGVTVLSVFCTVGLAAGLVGYSPITCGCVSPWETVAFGITGVTPGSADVLTVSYIEGNLFAKYYGKHISAKDLPFTNGPTDCVATLPPSHLIKCRWWIWRAPGRIKGFDVAVETDANGIFQKATAVEIEYIEKGVQQ